MSIRQRWQITTGYIANHGFLKQAIKGGSDISPCSEGLRSVFWKVFLLFKQTETSKWPKVLVETRNAYQTQRQHHLRHIENQVELKQALDPLDDDVNSPWNTLRKDEQVRAEILQDVERCMPENRFFQEPETQQILLNILFIFSKANPEIGYRQGMHELLAPIFWVVDQDVIDSDNNMVSKKIICEEQLMMEVLNRKFKEHDAYTLFSLLMRSAKSFYIMSGHVYGLSASLKPSQSQDSPILVRIQRIYDTYLECLDPELVKHLREIDVLPQMFLIRWIRLIFGREFCFSDLLALWDSLLAEDSSLDLVDMVCVAMLLRVRWQLIEADSSSALKILLNYPSLKAPFNSHELVSDGIYLRDNMNYKGGSEIILKYSGKLPKFMPEARKTSLEINPDSKDERKKNSSPSPSRFLEQQAGIETLLQEAAKGVITRGQRLGINKVFKEAVGEVKKNMQGFQSNRRSPNTSRRNFDEFEPLTPPKADIIAMNIRNQQLAKMLEQANTDLRAISTSGHKEVKSYIVAIEMAIAKIDFVKIYLEDSNMLFQETTVTLSPPSSTKAKPT